MGTKIYVTNSDGENTSIGIVSVIDTATNTVVTDIKVGESPYGIAVTPDGKKVYVANEDSNTISVINTKTNKVIATVPVGEKPNGVAVNPTGKKVYVANWNDDTVSVIDTTTNKVITNVTVGSHPVAIGQFIGGNVLKDKVNFSKTKAPFSKHKSKNHFKHHKIEKKLPIEK